MKIEKFQDMIKEKYGEPIYLKSYDFKKWVLFAKAGFVQDVEGLEKYVVGVLQNPAVQANWEHSITRNDEMKRTMKQSTRTADKGYLKHDDDGVDYFGVAKVH